MFVKYNVFYSTHRVKELTEKGTTLKSILKTDPGNTIVFIKKKKLGFFTRDANLKQASFLMFDGETVGQTDRK